MLKFVTGGKGGTTVIGLGIDAENVRLLKDGRNLVVHFAELFPDGNQGLDLRKVVFTIFYGVDVDDLHRQVEPFIGPDTRVAGTADRRKQDR